jgi:hypothetical protein
LLANIDPSSGVRLLGISASNFAPSAGGDAGEQLTFDDLRDASEGAVSRAHDAGWEVAEQTIDAIRGRFGQTVIGPASSVGARGLRVVRRGQQQWGPDQPPPSNEKGR